MSDWKSKVIEEASDLIVKIDKLEYFLRSSDSHKIAKEHRDLLIEQINLMTKYYDVLSERLKFS